VSADHGLINYKYVVVGFNDSFREIIIHGEGTVILFLHFLRKQQTRKDDDKLKRRARPKCSRAASAVLHKNAIFLRRKLTIYEFLTTTVLNSKPISV
jgi:hypothetical protein